ASAFRYSAAAAAYLPCRNRSFPRATASVYPATDSPAPGAAVAVPASQGESCLSVGGCGRSTHPSVTAAVAATGHFQRCRAKASTEGPNSGGAVVATTGAMLGVSYASTARTLATGACGAH